LTRESTAKNGFEMDPSRPQLVFPPDVEVFELHGSFFFGAAHHLMETIRFVERKPRAVILEMRGVLHMDATGLHALERIAEDCRKRGITLVLSGLHSQPYMLLDSSGKLDEIGASHIVGDLKEAFSSLNSPVS